MDDDNDNYDYCCTMIMMMINDDNCKSVALTEDMGCTVHSKPNFPKLNNGKLAEKDKSAISNKQQTERNGYISKQREKKRDRKNCFFAFWCVKLVYLMNE